MRRYWIAEEMWNSENEKQFRGDVINFDPNDETHLRRYMLTSKEYNDLTAYQRNIGKKQEELDKKQLSPEEITQIEREIKEETEDLSKKEKEASPTELQRKEMAKIRIQIRKKHRQIKRPSELENEIDAIHDSMRHITEEAKKRANSDNMLWPLYTKQEYERSRKEGVGNKQDNEESAEDGNED